MLASCVACCCRRSTTGGPCKLSGHSGAEERGEACDIAYASIGQSSEASAASLPTARDDSLLMAEGGFYATTACVLQGFYATAAGCPGVGI